MLKGCQHTGRLPLAADRRLAQLPRLRLDAFHCCRRGAKVSYAVVNAADTILIDTVLGRVTLMISLFGFT